MKKLFCLFFSIICIFTLCSCNSKTEYSYYISQLRTDIFTGESKNYSLQVFAEQKEIPFINDTVAGEKYNVLTVRILHCDTPLKIKVSYLTEEFCADAEYNPHAMSMTASFEVVSFPKDTLTVEIEGEFNETIECVSNLKSDTISPLTALNKVIADKNDFIKSITVDGELKAEIYVRLLTENDYNFYYVGFGLGSNKITAFLLDGKTGEIIAGKN